VTDTERGFMAAIIAAPDDDLPRLVFADRLEENAGTVACERCKGYGTVPNKESYSCGGVGEDRCPVCKGTRQEAVDHG